MKNLPDGEPIAGNAVFAACLLMAGRAYNDDFIRHEGGMEVVTSYALSLYVRTINRITGNNNVRT